MQLLATAQTYESQCKRGRLYLIAFAALAAAFDSQALASRQDASFYLLSLLALLTGAMGLLLTRDLGGSPFRAAAVPSPAQAVPLVAQRARPQPFAFVSPATLPLLALAGLCLSALFGSLFLRELIRVAPVLLVIASLVSLVYALHCWLSGGPRRAAKVEPVGSLRSWRETRLARLSDAIDLTPGLSGPSRAGDGAPEETDMPAAGGAAARRPDPWSRALGASTRPGTGQQRAGPNRAERR